MRDIIEAMLDEIRGRIEALARAWEGEPPRRLAHVPIPVRSLNSPRRRE